MKVINVTVKEILESTVCVPIPDDVPLEEQAQYAFNKTSDIYRDQKVVLDHNDHIETKFTCDIGGEPVDYIEY